MVGTPLLQEAQQKVGDPPGRRGVFAAAGGEGAGDHREEGAVDERVAVDQIERGRGTKGGHGPNNNAAKGGTRDGGGGGGGGGRGRRRAGEGGGNEKPRPGAGGGGGDAERREAG